MWLASAAKSLSARHRNPAQWGNSAGRPLAFRVECPLPSRCCLFRHFELHFWMAMRIWYFWNTICSIQYLILVIWLFWLLCKYLNLHCCSPYYLSINSPWVLWRQKFETETIDTSSISSIGKYLQLIRKLLIFIVCCRYSFLSPKMGQER